MNIRTYRLTLLILLGLTLFSAVAWGEDQGREFHWSGKLAADQLVRVKGVNGNIDADGTSGDQVEVTAEKSGANADQVKIQVVTDGDGVVICAIYPGSGSCSPSWHASHVRGDDAKVHFTVHMPKNLRFSGQNVNGDVIARGHGPFRTWGNRQWVGQDFDQRLGRRRDRERLHQSSDRERRLEWYAVVQKRERIGGSGAAG